MLPGEAPWTGHALLMGVPSLPRVKDLLDCAYVAVGRRIEDENGRTLIVDVSQDVCRSPWSWKVGCCTTSSQWYSYLHDRMICESEKFMLLGFSPDVNVASLNRNDLRDLGGEAMACYSIGTVLAAVLVSLNSECIWTKCPWSSP